MDKIISNDEKVNSIISTINKMFGQQEMLVNRKSEIITEISDANSYLDKKDEVSKILNNLQDRAQAKTKIIYEDLLTTLIHEVKGYDEENHRVVLNTKIKNNRPWLDVEIENAEGIPRDVFLDKGGSIKSIVSMGLRFITLSRTVNRRVIFFDEPDKEINARYADGIAKILYQLTKKIGMQVIYISHHDSSYFEGYARIVELSREKGSIVTSIVSDIDEKKYEDRSEEVIDDLDGVGIKYIRLKNLKQHQNTMIELSPFVTLLTGDNDIGKSSVMHAIDAVNKNKGRDGLIRDNESYCMVEIGLEEESNLNWTYKRSGSKRTKYSLKDSNNIEVQSSDSGTNPPEWLSLYLGMGIYKDFDLNMSDQNNTSFILDGKVSGHKRAEILSLGKETNQVLAMIKEHNQRCENFSKQIYHLKKELNKVKNKLECYRHLYAAEENIELINKSRKRAFEINNDIEQMVFLNKRISLLNKELDIIKNGMPHEIILMPIPAINEHEEYARKIFILNEKINQINLLNSVKVPDTPVIEDLSLIIKSGSKIKKMKDLYEILILIEKAQIQETKDLSITLNNQKLIKNIIDLTNRYEIISKINSGQIEPIKAEDNNEIIKVAQSIKEINNSSENLDKEKLMAQEELKKIEEEKEELLKSIGGECPLCGNEMKSEGHYHDKK